MRRIAAAPAHVREATRLTRFMLVTNPQANYPATYLHGIGANTSTKFAPRGSVVIFSYHLDDDAPTYEPWVFVSVESALNWLEENGVHALEWREIPDQLPGCLDDWIAPVRIYRGEDGIAVLHRWQRLNDGIWVEFEASPNYRLDLVGGYMLNIV